MSRRVVIGLSGGVDSAVSALLLKRRGYDVIGVHMVVWNLLLEMNWDKSEEGSDCPQSKDEKDARRVSDLLDIPFHSINLVKEYWNEVFVTMLQAYKEGRTLVPDIHCNRHIKFDHLHRIAIQRFDADFIATGHYASTSRGDFNDRESGDGRCRLLRGSDPLKDQSFFLSTLTEPQLKRSMFPLGSIAKRKVKEIAKENGLQWTVLKKESMGVCFVGKRRDFGSFLDEYVEASSGSIRLLTGEEVASHKGIHHFTVGKRIHSRHLSHLGLFVHSIHALTNTVYAVAGSHHPSLYATQFVIRKPEWICEGEEEEVLRDGRLSCSIQRSHTPLPLTIQSLDHSLLSLTPSLPLRAVAPGQMCVLYRGRECLGSGEVLRVQRTLDTKEYTMPPTDYSTLQSAYSTPVPVAQ